MIVKEKYDKKYRVYTETIFRKVIERKRKKANKLYLKLEKQNEKLSKLLQEYDRRFG